MFFEEVVNYGKAHLFLRLLHVDRRVDPNAVISLRLKEFQKGTVIAPDLKCSAPLGHTCNGRQVVSNGFQMLQVASRGTGEMLVVSKKVFRIRNRL